MTLRTADRSLRRLCSWWRSLTRTRRNVHRLFAGPLTKRWANGALGTATGAERLGDPGSRNPKSARDRGAIWHFARLEQLAPLGCSGLGSR